MFKNVKILTQYLSRYWVTLAVVTIASISAMYVRVLVPLFIGDAVNSVVGASSLLPIFHFSLLIILASCISALLQFTAGYGSQSLSQKFVHSLRNGLYGRLLYRNFSFFDHNSSGDLLSRSTMDVEALRRVVALGSSQLLTTTFLLIIAAISLYSLDILFLTVFLIIVPPLIIVTTVLQVKQRPFWRGIRKKYGEMNDVLQENIIGNRVIRSYTAENDEIKRFEKITGEYLSGYDSVSRIRAVFNPLLSLFVSLATASLLIYGGHEVILNNVSIGSLVSAINIFGLVLSPIRFYGRFVVILENGNASLQRLSEIMSGDYEAYETRKEETIKRGEVEFRNVSFSRSDNEVLHDINFKVKAGEVIGVVGKTGSGKSSLVSLMPRFYDPDKGQILLDGIDIRNFGLKDLRTRIGIVPQDIILFSGTIRENIAFGKEDASDEDIEKAAKIAQVADFIESLPDRYDTIVGERGITLSGGQKQRVAIARAIVANPEVLVLDDSTSSLDVHTEMELLSTVREAIKGRTTFILTHRMSTLKLTSRIIVIDEGRVVEDGDLNFLMSFDGIFRKIFDAQIAIVEKGGIF